MANSYSEDVCTYNVPLKEPNAFLDVGWKINAAGNFSSFKVAYLPFILFRKTDKQPFQGFPYWLQQLGKREEEAANCRKMSIFIYSLYLPREDLKTKMAFQVY